MAIGQWGDYATISPGSASCGTPSGYTVWHLIWPLSCNGKIVRCNDSQCDDDCLPGEYADYGGTFGTFYPGTLSFGFVYKESGIIKDVPGYYYIGKDSAYGEGYPGACGGVLGLYEYKEGVWCRQVPKYSMTIWRLSFCPPIAISFEGVSSIMYMDAKEMYIGLQDACGKNTQGLGPTPVKYYVKITDGKEWGYLYNEATGQYGDSILCTASDCDTSFMFLAMNQPPSEDQQVLLRVWSDDTSFIPATREIIVQSTKCMLLSVTKPQIRPGERDSISMMQNLWDGTSIPYPPDQLFSIRLDTSGGKWYGTLYCFATGDTGQVLNGLPQPFEFIAADSTNIDSTVVVGIEAKVQVFQGGACSIGVGKDTLRLHAPIMAKQQTQAKNIAPVPNEMNRKNLELSIKKLQSLLDMEDTKKGDEKQKLRLAYGMKKLKAQLVAYKTTMNPTKKQSSLVNIKQVALSFLGETGCTGIDSIKIKKRTIKHFCQGGGTWAGIKYDDYVKSIDAQGNKTYWTVGEKGCALTCMAMIAYAGGANIDPGTLANDMRNNYGFNQEHGVSWDFINNRNGNSGFGRDAVRGGGLKVKKDKTIDLPNSTPILANSMDQYLNQGYLIIAQVYNPTTKGNHWVLVTDKDNNDYSIIDPGCYSDRDNLSAYGSVYKYVVYKKL